MPGLLISLSRGFVIPILPLFVLSFEISYSWVGMVLAAQGLGTLVADIPAGFLLRRWGPRQMMLLGAGSMTLSMTTLFWVHDIYQVVAILFIAGVGGSLWNVALHTYLTDLIKTERRGRVIAVLGGISRLGMFAGPVLGGGVAATWGLNAPFLLFGIFGLSVVSAVVLWVEEARAERGEETMHMDVWAVLHGHRQILLTAGSGQLFAQLIRKSRLLIIPLFAADILGLGVEEIGIVISLGSALDMLMFYPAGWIMDRWGRKFAYVPCFFIQSAGMACLPFTTGFWSLLGVALIIGLGNGLGSGTMMTLGADLSPRKGRGEFLGIWRFIGDGGSMGSPIVVGGAADAVGLSAAPWVLAGIGVLGGSILWGLVPETLVSPRYAGTGGEQ